MKKQIIKALTAAMCIGICFAAPAQVKADYLPSTYVTIEQANAQKAAAMAELAKANTELLVLQANVETLKAQGADALTLLKATDAVTNTNNRIHWLVDQVNNAQAFIDNTVKRGTIEDRYQASVSYLADLNALQTLKSNVDGLNNIAGAAFTNVQNIKTAIAGYTNQLATCPSVQAQIDALNVQLAAAEADYAAKKAAADAKAAEFANALATTNWNKYDKEIMDYVDNRYNKPDKKEDNK